MQVSLMSKLLNRHASCWANSLCEIETVSFSRDTPDTSDSSVDVVSSDTDYSAESDDHEHALENIGDQNGFDAAYRRVEGTDYGEHQDAHGAG